MADINKSRELDEGKTQGNEVRLRTDGSAGDLTLKIDVDVSEAITGLKAVTREAKAAQKALRELETYYTENDKRYYVKWRQQGDESTDIREVCVSDIPTEYLSRELAKREDGVSVVNDLRDVQGQDGNWNHSEYMCGLFNGLELASATIEGRTPDYREIEDSVEEVDKKAPDYVEWSNGHISIAEYDLSVVPTAELSRALEKRTGFTEYRVAPEEKAIVQVYGVLAGTLREIEGPARILVYKD